MQAMEAANRALSGIINSNNSRHYEYEYYRIEKFSYKPAKKLVYTQVYHKTKIRM